MKPDLEIAARAVVGDLIALKRIHQNPEWKSFLEDHGVHQIIDQNMKQQQLDTCNEVFAPAAQELLRKKETQRVLSHLNQKNILPILMKGTPLAYLVYPQPSQRVRVDTDFLIKKESAVTVRQVMREIGYNCFNDDQVAPFVSQFTMTYQDPYGILHAFDIHWKISNRLFFADKITYDEAFQNGQSVPLLSPEAWALGPLHGALLACLHPAMHHRNCTHLLWIYDLHLISRSFSHQLWRQFTDMAVNKSVASICLDGVTKSYNYFKTPIPKWVFSDLVIATDHESQSTVFLNTSLRWYQRIWSDWQSLPSLRKKTRFLMDLILPAPKKVLITFGLQNSVIGPFLLPLLYVLRPLRRLLRPLNG